MSSQQKPVIKTKYRKIVTTIPAPDTQELLNTLRKYEPRSMSGQPPVFWDKAKGFQVMDRHGNTWIDFSSGVLVTATGHGQPKVQQAVREQLKTGVLHNYCFPSSIRAQLVEKLVSLLPEPLKKVFLLTTGSETIECALKLARTWGPSKGERKRTGIITYLNAFHGRTLGSQMVGGLPGQLDWIPFTDPSIHRMPFPDGYRNKDVSFNGFLKQLDEQHVDPSTIACVLCETYQGGSVQFAPPEYFQAVRRWCNDNGVLLIFDEVQAGFGRTGTMFGFEHYGVVPDLACFGKGISGGLPLSAVAGRPEIMDLYAPGSMTSTHTGNPIACAAALANIEIIEEQKLVENSRRLGELAMRELLPLKDAYPDVIGAIQGKGLVIGIHFRKPGTDCEPNPELALRITNYAIAHGVLLFAPVGVKGTTIKLNPPLIINEAAMREAIGVVKEAVAAGIAA